MELELRINGIIKSLDVASNESLLAVLRQEGYYSVKHGCETGECGACTVLVDGLPRPTCVMLAAQAGAVRSPLLKAWVLPVNFTHCKRRLSIPVLSNVASVPLV